MRKIQIHILALSLVLLLFAGCTQKDRSTGVYMLLDTSGTYALELEKAQSIINYLLGTLNPGDTMAVARIDTGSFSEKDIVAKAEFEDRPSVSNQQKRVFKDLVDKFVKDVKSSPYTDITGGILQGTEYLNEAGSGKRIILIFSDMKEEIKKGYKRDIPLDLKDVTVVALNVTKLRSDNVDPREYMDRLEEWRSKVEAGGGKWKVVNDLERLEGILN